ncbi:Hsp20/alpha crystallin family protein [Saccharothrix lopnurensis]|uniref:Hsp20/alpha crystallin family protein n=1 Tax=Saccharothrix lopnurensis TaxID=1670621 RepID=A0ABW1PGW6_9PSEU
MNMRTDHPFRQLERLTQQVFGDEGTPSRSSAVPMDAYRRGDEFFVQFDLPGVSPDSIDLSVERNVLTVRAERAAEAGEAGEERRWQVAERPRGVFSRRVFLGDALDSDRIEADYEAGVLTLRIPVAEKAQPRRIAVGRRERVDA